MKTLTDPNGLEICYLGMGPEAGPLPAYLYFSLSGEESLTLHPYNSPAALLEGEMMRVFSVTLPGHGPGFDKFKAMQFWAEGMDDYVLETFFEQVVASIGWLFDAGWIESLAVGGLSRGGFVAGHIAVREKRVSHVLNFAPVTRLSMLKEFASPELSDHAKLRAQALDLENHVAEMTHLKGMRCYIGNRDERVDTEACFAFVRKLAEVGHEVRARHLDAEMVMTRSIGHEGHGTAPHIFEEGAMWLKKQLVG